MSKGDDVGYGRPPKHSRFQKGSSGNPTGRPRGTPSITAVFRKALREKVIVVKNGKRRKITKFEAAATQLANRVAAGDIPALKVLLNLGPMLELAAEPAGDSDRIRYARMSDEQLEQELEELKTMKESIERSKRKRL